MKYSEYLAQKNGNRSRQEVVRDEQVKSLNKYVENAYNFQAESASKPYSTDEDRAKYQEEFRKQRNSYNRIKNYLSDNTDFTEEENTNLKTYLSGGAQLTRNALSNVNKTLPYKSYDEYGQNTGDKTYIGYLQYQLNTLDSQIKSAGNSGSVFEHNNLMSQKNDVQGKLDVAKSKYDENKLYNSLLYNNGTLKSADELDALADEIGTINGIEKNLGIFANDREIYSENLSKLNELKSKYKDVGNKSSEVSAYLRATARSVRNQENLENLSSINELPEFESIYNEYANKYPEIVKEMSVDYQNNPNWTEAFKINSLEELSQPGIGNDIKSREFARKYLPEQYWDEYDELIKDKSSMSYATDEEKKIAVTYFANGMETGNFDDFFAYRKALNQTIQERAAEEIYKEHIGFSKYPLSFVIGGVQYIESLGNLFTSEAKDYSYLELLNSKLSEKAKEESAFGGLAYSSINSIGNMAIPLTLSILTSGAAVVPAGIGLSSLSSGKMEALRGGYTNGQSWDFGIQQGLSEALMESVLGAATKFAGSFAGKTGFSITDTLTEKLTSAVKKMNPTLGKIVYGVGTLGISGMGEFSDEYLQEVFNPVFRNIALGEHNKFQFYTDEALEAGLAGALTGAIFGGIGAIKDYKAIKDGFKTPYQAQRDVVTSTARVLPQTSAARTLADVYVELCGESTFSNLEEIESMMSSDIVVDINSKEYSEGYNDAIANINQYVKDGVIDKVLLKRNLDSILVDKKSADYKAGAQDAIIDKTKSLIADYADSITPTLDADSPIEERDSSNIEKMVCLYPPIFQTKSGEFIALENLNFKDNRTAYAFKAFSNIENNRGLSTPISLESANYYIGLINSGRFYMEHYDELLSMYATGLKGLQPTQKNTATRNAFLNAYQSTFIKSGNSIADKLYTLGHNDSVEYNKTSNKVMETIGSVIGVPVNFYKSTETVNNKTAVRENKWVVGYHSRGKGNVALYEALESHGFTQSAISTFVHEAVHFLYETNPEAYKQLQAFTVEYAERVIPNKLAEFRKLVLRYDSNYSTYLNEELTCRLMEPIFTTKSFVETLKNDYPEIFGEIGSEIFSLFTRVRDTNIMSAWGREDLARLDVLTSLFLDGVSKKKISEHTKKKIESYKAKLKEESELELNVTEISEMDESKVEKLDVKTNIDAVLKNADFLEENGIDVSFADDAKYLKLAENETENNAELQKIIIKKAKENGYTYRAYHGTARADRVGNVFRADRATSGPFAYFTDSYEIAENYSKDKNDTSILKDSEYDSPYTQFRIKKGNETIAIVDAWNLLSQDAKDRITKKALGVTFDDDYENIVFDESRNNGLGDLNGKLKRKNNTISALIDEWLTDGNLLGNEEKFLEVIKLSGVEEELSKIEGLGEIVFNNPDARYEKVYDVFIKMENPFNTNDINEKFINEFESWAQDNDLSQYEGERIGDLWDKNNVTAQDFAEQLRDDLESGNTLAWTSIPDSMTAFLKSNGYDGIIDKGGKNGGNGHTVLIPFTSVQVKSADPVVYDDYGMIIPPSERFNENVEDIRYSIEPKAPVFYSKLGDVVIGLDNDKKYGANEVIPLLKNNGVKDEEIKWSGIVAFLEGKKSVTKEELLDFVNENSFEFEETILKDNEESISEIGNRLNELGINYNYDEWFSPMDNQFSFANFESSMDEYLEDGDISKDTHDELIKIGRSVDTKTNTRWKEHAVTGGSNYQEVMFKIPDSDYSNEAMMYHWGESGVFAHARYQQLSSENGPVLFVEEIQSDWHNEGKRVGYKGYYEESARLELSKRIYEKAQEVRQLEEEYKSILSPYSVEAITNHETSYEEIVKNYENFMEKLRKARHELQELEDSAERMDDSNSLRALDAPFKKTYTDFSMKWLIREAIENNMKGIAWTTAEMQSKRWSDEYAEGYRIEYDQEIPKFMKKYCKQWGAEVTKKEITNSYGESFEAWYVEFTPEMKETVMYAGQPLFDTYINEESNNIELDLSKIEGAEKVFNSASSEIKFSVNDTTPENIVNEIISVFNPNASDEAINEFVEAGRQVIEYFATTPNIDYSTAMEMLRTGSLLAASEMTDQFGNRLYSAHDAKDKAYELGLTFFKKYAENLEEINPDLAGRIVEEIERVINLEKARARENTDEAVKRALQKRAYRVERAELRDTVKSLLAEIGRRATKPTRKKYIPQAMMKHLGDLADALDPTTNRRVSAPNAKWRELAETYRKLKEDRDYQVSSVYDDTIARYIDEIAQITNDGARKMYDLNVEELRKVRDVLKHLITIFRNDNEFLAMAGKIDEAGKKVISEVDEADGVATKSLIDSYLRQTLNPERLARRIVGYADDSPLVMAIQSLMNGELKSQNFLMGYADLFSEMDVTKQTTKETKRKAREYKKRFDKLNSTWETVKFNGKEYEITEAMKISLIMHSRNNDNMKHIVNGGFVIPNKKIYQSSWIDAGAMSNSYAKGETVVLQAHTDQEGNLVSNDIETLKEGLDEFEKWLLDTCVTYYEEYSANAINETSLVLYGYKAANVENYFPIIVDRNLLNTVGLDAQSNPYTVTITHSMLHPRESGTSAIMLNGIVQDLTRSSQFVAKYYGLAIPLRDYQRLLNVGVFGNGVGYGVNVEETSVRKTIANKWNQATVDSLIKITKDVSGAFDNSDTTTIDKLRSNSAKAVLTLNFGVAIKQAASFPTAIAELDYPSVIKAFFAGGKNNTMLSRADKELISKYTSILWSRGKTSTQEVAEIRINSRHSIDKIYSSTPYLFSWIEKVDVATVGRLWYATQYWIDSQQKQGNVLYKDLVKGSEDYYRAVAEKFNQVVWRTQPNYSVMTRPEILKNKNQFVKALFMFKTQPLQNAGILVDAISNYNAKAKAYKAGNLESRAEVRLAGQKMARAITSQALQTFVFVGMTVLADLLLRRMDKYDDDETGEVTVGSFLNEVAWQYFDSLSGNTVIMEWFADLAEFAVRKYVNEEDVQYYAPSAFGFEDITELFTSVESIVNGISNGSDVSSYVESLASSFAQLAGIPVDNVRKIYTAIINHAMDFATASTVKDVLGLNPTEQSKGFADSFASKLANKELKRDINTLIKNKNNDSVVEETFNKILDETTYTSDIISLLKIEFNNGDADTGKKIREWIVEYLGYTEEDASDLMSGWANSYKDEFVESDDYEEVIDEVQNKYGFTDEEMSKKLISWSDTLKKDYCKAYVNGNEDEINRITLEMSERYRMSTEEIHKKILSWQTSTTKGADVSLSATVEEEEYQAKVEKKKNDYNTGCSTLKEDINTWHSTGNATRPYEKSKASEYLPYLYQHSSNAEREKIWSYAVNVLGYSPKYKASTVKGWMERNTDDYLKVER